MTFLRTSRLESVKPSRRMPFNLISASLPMPLTTSQRTEDKGVGDITLDPEYLMTLTCLSEMTQENASCSSVFTLPLPNEFVVSRKQTKGSRFPYHKFNPSRA